MKSALLLILLSLTLAVKSNAQSGIDTTLARAPFTVRGFHLDLRIQVMKMPALKEFALSLREKGINTIIMEWEATYPFTQDPLIPNRFAYTKEEVTSFVTYCKTLNIDVIPLQQSFGHVEYILRHDKYAALREDEKMLSQVCPSEPELNKELFTRLFKELIETHPSNYFHIGGDETYLLGHCEKCKARVQKSGLSQLYFDHIKLLCDIVTSLGKKPVLWADIALKYPQFINLLPKETIFVDWNYGMDMNRFGKHEALVKSGYEVWGAPAIRSSPDNFFLSKWSTHFKNIRDFIPVCRALGYKGMVMTSWSTSGAYAYSYESEDDLVDLSALRHVYPINGFDLLIAAYSDAITSTRALSINSYINNYMLNRFGFWQPQSELFAKALFTAPYSVSEGKVISNAGMTINELLDSATWAAKTIASLTPKRNADLYEHFKLMCDIRVHYLTYMAIEEDANKPDFNQAKVPATIASLKSLMQKEPELDKRFTKLQTPMLYPAAIEEENTLRNQKVLNLYNRLSRIK